MSIKYDGFSDIGGVDYNEGGPVAGGTQGSIQFNDGQGNFAGHPMANVVVEYDPATGNEYANIYATNLILTGDVSIKDPLYGVIYSESQTATTSEILFINPETSTMTLYGNMVVTGDVNTLGANNLIVSDNIIEVGSNASDSTNVGIVYQRPAGNVMTGYVTGGQYDNTFVIAHTDNSAFSYELHPNTESNIHMSVVGNVGIQNSNPLHYLSLGEAGAQGTQYFEGNVIITSTGTTVRIGKEQDVAVNPSDFTVAVGEKAGFDTQGSLSVSVGASAGQFSQGVRAIAIGRQAGRCNQSDDSVSIGAISGREDQGSRSVAIGAFAARLEQGSNAAAVGFNAGRTSQGANASAVGYQAGLVSQGDSATAIGANAAHLNQQANAVAIGFEAGNDTQGANAVAIGYRAGATNQHENTVIINATGVDLDSDRPDAIFMAPMRYLPLETTSNVVTYNPTTGEVTQSELISNSFDLQNTCDRGNTYSNTITVGNLVAQNNVEAIQFLGNGAHLVSTTNVQDGNYGDTDNVVAITITDGRITALTNVASNIEDLQNTCEQGNTYDSTITVGNLVATHNVEAIQFLGNASHLVSTTNVQDGNYGDDKNVVAITITDGRITTLTNTPGYLQDLQNVGEQGNTYDSSIILTHPELGLRASGNVEAVQFIGNAAHLVSTTNVQDGNYGDTDNVVAITITDGRITALTNVASNVEDLQNTCEQGNTYDSAIILTSTDENLVLSGMIKSASEEVAYGSGFSKTNVAARGIRLGHVTADTSQGSYSVAMGYQAGQTDQGEQAVAIGWGCGGTTQGSRGIAIGRNSGNNTQGIEAIALGFRTGRLTQGVQGIAVGTDAGENTQGDLSVAVGVSAGRTSQGGRSVAIGPTAGNTDQGDNAIAVGFRAGQTGQGEHAVAVGTDAGKTNQADNSIVVNATGSTLENTTASSLVVKPVRYDSTHQNTMSYNATTGEITHSENVEALHFFGNASHLVSTTNVADDTYGGVGNVAAITILDGRITALTNVAVPAELQDLQNTCEQGNAYDSSITVGNLVATHNVEALQFIGNAAHLVSTTNVADDTYGGLGNIAAITITDGRIASIVNVASPEVQDLQNVCEIGNTYDSAIQLTSTGNNLVLEGMIHMLPVVVGSGRSASTQVPDNAVCIGKRSTDAGQGTSSVSIGTDAGETGLGNKAVAIGQEAGEQNAGIDSVNIGYRAARFGGGTRAVSVGAEAGRGGRGNDTVAVGYRAGFSGQSSSSVAVGAAAGQTDQGARAVALGVGAGNTGQHSGSIAINAGTGVLDTTGTEQFHVKPIRYADGTDLANVLVYDAATFEVTHSNLLPSLDLQNTCERGNVYDSTMTVGNLVATHNVEALQFLGNASHLVSTTNVADDTYGGLGNIAAITITDGRIASIVNVASPEVQDLQNVCEIGNVYDSTMTVGNLVATHNVEALQFLGNAAHLVSTTNVADDTYGGVGNVAAITILDGRITDIVNVASPEVQDLQNVVEQGNVTTWTAEFMNTENAIKTNLISNVIIDPNQLNNVVIDYATIEEKHTLVWDGDNWVNHFPEEIVTDTEADVAISKGQAVYVSDGSGATPKISPADPTDPAKMPSIGVALENGGVGDHIHVCTKGVINVDLTGMTVGNTVYVSNTTPGDLMDYRPSGDTDLVQNIGIVIKEGNGGKLLVTGVGRTNDVPNTTTNSMKELDITGIYVQDTGNVITKIGFESLAQMVTTKVEASVAVALGELVYVDGVNAGMPTVSLAQSDSTARCPYAGFMCEALNPGEIGRMATHGVIITDTGSFSDGTQVWLSNTVPGGMMDYPPDYVDTDLIQSVGFVIDAATQGRLLLINPGRVTAVPNTTLQLPGAITANGVYVEDLATGDFTRVPVSDLAQDLQNVCETGNVYNSAITVTNVLTTNVVSTNVSGNGSGLTSTTDVADDTYGGLGNVAQITILDGRVTQIQNVEAPMLLQDLQNTSEQGNTYDSAIQLTSTGNNLVLSGMVYSASEEVAFGSGFSKASVAARGIRLGHTEVDTAQGSYSIAMGYQAGETDQGSQSIAMGWAAGSSNQGSQAIAIGRNCGSSDQEQRAIAVGYLAGQDRQGSNSVAVGPNAGQSDQGFNGVALGADAAKTSQGTRAVAVGSGTGAFSQNTMAVAIGYLCAQSGQGSRSVAIGVNAGRLHQNAQAVAIGQSSGRSNQGSFAVALGASAGHTSQADNSIVINATGVNLDATADSSLVVKPVRYDSAHQNTLSYNATTGEITHSENVSAANYFGNASTLTSLTGAATGTWGGTGNAASVVVGADGYVSSISNVPATFSATGTDTEIAFFDAEGNITSSGDYYYDTSMGNVYLTGNLTIDGNLVVDGDITKVDTTTLSVVNPIAEFNNDGADVTAGIILNRTDGGNTMMGYLSTESGGIYDEKLVFARTLSGADDTTLTPLVSNKLEVVVVGNLTADYVTTNAAFMVSTTNVADDTYGGVGNVCAVTIADGRITALTNVAVPAALQDLQNVGETGNTYDLQITVGNVATDNVVSINVSGNGSGLTSTTDVADDTYGGGLNVAAITILNGRVTQIQNTQGHLQDLQNVCEQGNAYTLEATFGNVATTNVVTTNVSGNGSGLTSTTDVADDIYGGGLNVAAITILNGRVTDISNTQGHLQDLQNVCEQGNVYTLEATFGNIAATNVVTTNVSGNGSHLTSLVEAAATTYGAYDAVAATANIAQITVSTDGRITSIANVEISTTGPDINDLQSVGDLGNTYNSTLQLTTNPVGIQMAGGIMMDNPTQTTIIGGADINFASTPQSATIIGPRPDVSGAPYVPPGDYTVSIGPNAGHRGQSNYALAIGNQAGRCNQGQSTVAIGSGAARDNQGNGSVAIGLQAGQVSQRSDSIAIGFQAAKDNQGFRSIALGRNAGQSTQGKDSIAFGYLAGTSTQGSQALAIGTGAGKVDQGDSSVALGYQAGQLNQKVNCLAIGVNSGRVDQGSGGFAVGTNAGENKQGERAFAMGFHAGKNDQGFMAMALGYQAASQSQGSRSIAVGANAQRVCTIGFQPDRVAIGFQAGECNQESQSIAIGYRAGHNNMGTDSIAIGALAGGTNMGSNSILLSAAGESRQFQVDSGFGVTPVRSTAVGGTQGNVMHYDPTTFEIRYDTAKTFVIPHPNRPGRLLVHGCLEGPEGGVYYRGKGNSTRPVRLPDYVPDLVNGDEPTIHVTPIGNNQSLGVSEWNRATNSFRVIADRPTDFHWTFTAMRIPVDVEPFETEVEVKGQGPYTYI